jgi:hypothetical protein
MVSVDGISPSVAEIAPLIGEAKLPLEIVFEDSSEAKTQRKMLFEQRPIGITIKPSTMPLRVSTVSDRVAEAGVSQGFIIKTVAGFDVASADMTADQAIQLLEKATARLPESGPMVDMVFEDKAGSTIMRRLVKDAYGMRCVVKKSLAYETGAAANGLYNQKYSIKVHSVEHFAIVRGIRPKWIVKSIGGRELQDISEAEANELVEEINGQQPSASAVDISRMMSLIDDSSFVPFDGEDGEEEYAGTSSVTFRDRVGSSE